MATAAPAPMPGSEVTREYAHLDFLDLVERSAPYISVEARPIAEGPTSPTAAMAPPTGGGGGPAFTNILGPVAPHLAALMVSPLSADPRSRHRGIDRFRRLLRAYRPSEAEAQQQSPQLGAASVPGQPSGGHPAGRFEPDYYGPVSLPAGTSTNHYASDNMTLDEYEKCRRDSGADNTLVWFATPPYDAVSALSGHMPSAEWVHFSSEAAAAAASTPDFLDGC
ncbi:hypothetical protein H696_04797 [Fonticula alba]|uniref:Uncharacterized protein n=1 Tax=Fonticula alba TaxID=691883 RepID=A0A058Z2P2_FONAL|nr:hypothetical protein H696_04797 [Fonticula alba]KCV68505.1 hypothetical protein H696_04797 [Fonticula alba]|eukprot:XP_009496937.1 hypothetical protein H696_04797 [Fonticula alba]